MTDILSLAYHLDDEETADETLTVTLLFFYEYFKKEFLRRLSQTSGRRKESLDG